MSQATNAPPAALSPAVRLALARERERHERAEEANQFSAMLVACERRCDLLAAEAARLDAENHALVEIVMEMRPRRPGDENVPGLSPERVADLVAAKVKGLAP